MDPLLVAQTVSQHERAIISLLGTGHLATEEKNAGHTGKEARFLLPLWERSEPQVYKIPYDVRSAKRKSLSATVENIPADDRGFRRAKQFDTIVECLEYFVEQPPRSQEPEGLSAPSP